MSTMSMGRGQGLGFDYQAEQDQIAQRQRVADMLMKMSQGSMPQGQMAGRVYVAPSWLQTLAPVAQAYAGTRAQDQVAGDKRKFASDYNQALAQGVQGYMKQRMGTPSMPVGPAPVPGSENPSLEDPPDQVQQMTAAVPGDPRGAAVRAITSGLPALAQIGVKDMENLAKNELTAKDLLSIPGATVGSRVNAATSMDPRRLAADPKLQTVNEQVFAFPEGGGAPNRVLNAQDTYGMPVDIRGDLYQTQGNTGKLVKMDNAAKVTVGGPTVSVDAGSKAGFEAWAKKAVETVDTLSAGARASARSLTALKTIENSTDAGVYQGPLANFGVKIGQLASAMGMKVDANKLANSETTNSEVVRLWADMMQANGGARGLVKEESEKMMESLPQLAQTPEGRRQIIRVMRMKAEQDIEVAKQANAELAAALQSTDSSKFTFGLGMTMLPSPAMDPKPGVPGLPVNRPQTQPEIRNWNSR